MHFICVSLPKYIKSTFILFWSASRKDIHVKSKKLQLEKHLKNYLNFESIIPTKTINYKTVFRER